MTRMKAPRISTDEYQIFFLSVLEYLCHPCSIYLKHCFEFYFVDHFYAEVFGFFDF